MKNYFNADMMTRYLNIKPKITLLLIPLVFTLSITQSVRFPSLSNKSPHVTSPYLNGLQVPLHASEFALQCHHSSQVIAQALGGFNHFGLFLHPSLDLITLQMVVLDVKGRL